MPLLAMLPLLACGGGGAPVAPDPPDPPCAAAPVAFPQPVQLGDTRDVHDPEIVRAADGDFYVLSTNDGIPIRRSRDLLTWTRLGRVFPDQLPGWARGAVPGVQAPWAPGLKFWDGEFHLYYSLSTFGSPRSVIGLATNSTLDPGAAGYQWQDHGKVVESFAGYDYNAIDPAVVEDAQGGLWLSWGSWGGGIKLHALDRATGLFSRTDTTTYAIARRPAEQAIEGPYIVRSGAWFYLFASFDNCCRGVDSNYNVRVGRAAQVTGPYLDRDGVIMTAGGGTPVLTGYGRVRGPGHASVLELSGQYLLVHHYYDSGDAGAPHLMVRPLLWDADGWPVAGEQYEGTGQPAGPPPPSTLPGRWAWWAGDDTPRAVELKADGTIGACDRQGTWSYSAPTLTVVWKAGGAFSGARTDRVLIGQRAASVAGWSSDRRIVRGYRLTS